MLRIDEFILQSEICKKIYNLFVAVSKIMKRHRKDFEHVGVVIDIFKGLLGLGMFRYWFFKKKILWQLQLSVEKTFMIHFFKPFFADKESVGIAKIWTRPTDQPNDGPRFDLEEDATYKILNNARLNSWICKKKLCILFFTK